MSINTFFGLQIGREALQAQQRALEVTGHNIANANTEGYSRQQAIFATPEPYAMPSYNKPLVAGQVGTGVYIQEIRRMRDDFIDGQMRKENTATSEWGARGDVVGKLELIINEPSDSGLRTVLDQFWQSLQDLSKNPEDGSVRSLVRQRGIAVTEAFNHIDSQLADVKADLNSSIKIKADEINNIASQIASLNDQIVKVEVSGDHANDLRDKRDLLLDNLSKLVNIHVTEPVDQYGAITVAIGGRPLVMNNIVNKIQANPVAGDYFLQWSDNSTNVTLTGGLIKGMIDGRDVSIASYKTQFDKIALELVNEFNTRHSAGYGLDGLNGNKFFTGTDAKTIAMDPVITSSGPPPGYNHIAAASLAANVPGDGSNAINLAEIKNFSIAGLSGTIDDYYRGMAGQLGVESQAAKRMVENQGLLISELGNRKQSISGVSLDEEMTNMVKFQHAYSAAARVVTTMDEMLDTIVNKLGLVGR